MARCRGAVRTNEPTTDTNAPLTAISTNSRRNGAIAEAPVEPEISVMVMATPNEMH